MPAHPLHPPPDFQVETKDAALADLASTDPDRVAAAQAVAQRKAEGATVARAAEDGGADEGGFNFGIKLSIDTGGGGGAVESGKLQLAASQLGETRESLREMTERAKAATEARRAMEEELAPLR
jgi:hypothetical protein